jgi:hypothetical protein
MAPSPGAAAPALRLAAAPEFELPLEAGLSVDDLEDLFEASGRSLVASVAEANPVVAIEEDFVVLQDSVPLLEDGFSVFEDSFEAVPENALLPGGVEDLSDVYESPSEPVRPQLHLVSREEQPFDQLVDDFVDSLRRLTRECLGS